MVVRYSANFPAANAAEYQKSAASATTWNFPGAGAWLSRCGSTREPRTGPINWPGTPLAYRNIRQTSMPLKMCVYLSHSLPRIRRLILKSLRRVFSQCSDLSQESTLQRWLKKWQLIQVCGHSDQQSQDLDHQSPVARLGPEITRRK